MLLESMSKGRRKAISKAERSGLEMKETTRRQVGDAYDLLKETYTRAGVLLARPTFFENAHRILQPGGFLWSVVAVHEGTPCACRLVQRWKGTLYDWYAGSSETGRRLHADEWLVWEILRRGVREGCTLFDFGGAGRSGEEYGPGEFKRRFGGKPVSAGRLIKSYRPLMVRFARKTYALLSAAS